MDKIHFWDFPPHIRIKLNEDFRKDFFRRVVEQLGTSNNAARFLMENSVKYGFRFKITGSAIRRYKSKIRSKNRSYIQVWIIVEFAKMLNYNLARIEKSVISYRCCGGARIINPVLPIEVTPEFDSIVAHIMGDGTDKRTSRGAASYCQYSFEGRKQFYDKIENVFGRVDPPSYYENRKDLSVGIPRPIVMIIKKHYSIPSFGSHDCYVPEKIIKGPRENRLAFLISFIIDEGTVYDFISIRTSNKRLMRGLRRITLSLGYACSDVKEINNTGGLVYGLNISNYSLGHLYIDFRRIKEKYKTFNLLNKNRVFEHIVSLSRHNGPKRCNYETKGIIISILMNEPSNVIGLSLRSGVCRRTVRNHLEDLKNKNIVKVKEIGKMGVKIWALK